jgi:hypothetical protein
MVRELLNSLWDYIGLQAQLTEQSMLQTINAETKKKDKDKSYTSLKDYLTEVYTDTGALYGDLANWDREEEAVWWSIQEAIDSDQARDKLARTLVDRQLFLDLIKECRKAKNKGPIGDQLERRILNVVKQESDFSYFLEKQFNSHWNKYNPYKSPFAPENQPVMAIRRESGHGADYIAYTIISSKQYSWTPTNQLKPETIIERGDIKSNAEKFVLTESSIGKPFFSNLSGPFATALDTLKSYAIRQILPTQSELKELILVFRVYASLAEKQYPYFVSVHQSEIKITLCSDTLFQHIEPGPNGYYASMKSAGVQQLMADLNQRLQSPAPNSMNPDFKDTTIKIWWQGRATIHKIGGK